MSKLEKQKKQYQSKEAQFLDWLFDELELDKVTHPIFGSLISQLSKLLMVLDMNEGYQTWMAGVLTKIKGNWK